MLQFYWRHLEQQLLQVTTPTALLRLIFSFPIVLLFPLFLFAIIVVLITIEILGWVLIEGGATAQ